MNLGCGRSLQGYDTYSHGLRMFISHNTHPTCYAWVLPALNKDIPTLK
jgi:hypothetical protein